MHLLAAPSPRTPSLEPQPALHLVPVASAALGEKPALACRPTGQAAALYALLDRTQATVHVPSESSLPMSFTTCSSSLFWFFIFVLLFIFVLPSLHFVSLRIFNHTLNLTLYPTSYPPLHHLIERQLPRRQGLSGGLGGLLWCWGVSCQSFGYSMHEVL